LKKSANVCEKFKDIFGFIGIDFHKFATEK
jgi:hypothetical protein